MILEVACPIPVFKTFDYSLPDHLRHLKSADLLGRRVMIPFGYKKSVGVVCAVKDHSTAPLDKLRSILEVIDPSEALDSAALELGRWLSDRTVCSLGEALFSLLPPRRTDFKSRENIHDPTEPRPAFLSNDPVLTPTQEQADAISRLRGMIESKVFSPVLLMGLAATGKTEVYMAVLESVLSLGRRALILAPEIGLVEQMGRMLKARFGDDQVLIFHSDVSPKQRVDDWWRIKQGQGAIIVGARSAVLAPLDNIGVIVMDEEHDTAYKEDRKPRFQTREVAWRRAEKHQSLLIYGGATPSLELLHKAQTGAVTMIEIQERAVAAAKPEIRLIDMKHRKARGLLSSELIEAMAARFTIREQILLLLNRRGFFRYLKCSHCTWVARCPNCAITLVRHKIGSIGKGRRKQSGYWCHACSYVMADVARCPECGQKEMFAGGFGTERIEEEIQTQFPWVHAARWDRDSAGRRGSHLKIFQEFFEGKHDVLIGTQIVAQGFNFPKVTLVGVLDADTALHIPDFRSAERTFQLITQVAGRSGRDTVSGTVLVQTRHPDHYAIRFAADMDIKGFASHELKFREELNYPPFRRLVRIVTFGKKAEPNSLALSEWGEKFDGTEPLSILGPSPVKKMKGKGPGQFQLLIKVCEADTPRFLLELKHVVERHPSEYWIDVDPDSLA